MGKRKEIKFMCRDGRTFEGRQDGEKLDRNQRPAYDPELAQRRFQANLRRRGKPQQAGT